MKEMELEIILPDGKTRLVQFGKESTGTTLAEALEGQGIPLNMRCSGRGLCRGCEVVVNDNGHSKTIQTCQHNVGDLPDSIKRLSIPANSWRDHSLHGVSVFEIHTDTVAVSSRQSGYGLALDIGTTTLAGALWDFSSNRCLTHGSLGNPQARFGDNVLSRVHYCIGHKEGCRALQRTLVEEGLEPMIMELCQAAGIEPEAIDCATASGNPTMLHTLLGASLNGLGKYPFKPVFIDQRQVDSRTIGFDYAFELTLLPGLGPFVGADIVAGALASGMLEDRGPVLFVDFGTNGEILLSHEGGFFATATAAGPAFEGGRLSCGSAAREGVISSIRRENESWVWHLSGASGGEPNGISGAAFVDFLASGKECGLLDHFGRFDRHDSEVYERRSGEDVDWVIAISPKTVVTEADVAELLQAKAAIGGGVASLMELAGIEASDLRKVLVAGGFGYHLNPAHAIAIGLLPDISVDKIKTVGNASLGGACLLLNEKMHDLMRPLLDTCQVIELNQVESFEDHFTDCLMLEPLLSDHI